MNWLGYNLIHDAGGIIYLQYEIMGESGDEEANQDSFNLAGKAKLAGNKALVKLHT